MISKSVHVFTEMLLEQIIARWGMIQILNPEFYAKVIKDTNDIMIDLLVNSLDMAIYQSGCPTTGCQEVTPYLGQYTPSP